MSKILKHISLCLSTLLWSVLAFAQTAPPSDIQLDDLRQWLRENWHDGYHDALGYNQARIQMYGFIDNVDGYISCIYTGFTQDGGYVTFPDPINAEHLVPQSFYGSAEPMKSDIFILRPCHQSANSARSNYPFGEVNDASAQWFGIVGNNYTTQGNIPSNHENWSEKTGATWEPREQYKGDIARSVFYFYTMYPDVAGELSDVGNPNTLYQWHLDDPVDAEEQDRNDKVESQQGNRNPYVDYPDLVWDAWFWEEAAVDTDGPVITGEEVIYLDCSQYPNSEIYITATDENGPITVTYFDSGNPSGCEYEIIRTYVAVDLFGNTTTFSQILQVIDITPPYFINFPETIIIDCGEEGVELEMPEAVDECSNAVMMMDEMIMGDPCPSAHQILRMVTAMDECGNTVTATQTIIVNEYIEPSGCGSDLSGDGFITVEDILLALSEFGCVNECNHDVDGDGIVAVGDILEILANFGSAC